MQGLSIDLNKIQNRVIQNLENKIIPRIELRIHHKLQNIKIHLIDKYGEHNEKKINDFLITCKEYLYNKFDRSLLKKQIVQYTGHCSELLSHSFQNKPIPNEKYNLEYDIDFTLKIPDFNDL